LNPRRGTQIAVAEAARNVACVGAKPIAITNCLNFGNPYDPEIYWQFTEAIAGMREACLAFNTPVTGGNVSFYNESPSGAIMPTPVIGMLGLLDDISNAVGSHFQSSGDAIIELGVNKGEVGGSEYLTLVKNEVTGDAPEMNLTYEGNLHKLCESLAKKKIARSMHDISDGGIAVALVECCNNHLGFGCKINLDYAFKKSRKDFICFGESQSIVIVSCPTDKVNTIMNEASKFSIDAKQIGVVTNNKRICIESAIDLDVSEALEAYNETIEKRMPIEEE
jgi:phosphoribosylformylglycinamidine synthase